MTTAFQLEFQFIPVAHELSLTVPRERQDCHPDMRLYTLSLDSRPIKIRPGTYCRGDSAHALVYSPESGESPFSSFISLALYCVVPEGFHTSLKPEEVLIYLYDGCMVRMSYLGSVQAMGSVWCLKLPLAKTTRL